MSSSYLVRGAVPGCNLVPGLTYYRIVLHNHLGCSQTTSGNVIFYFQMGRLGKLLWESEWKLLVVLVHLESMTMQKRSGCVYGHLCILYISDHSPCKAPDLKLKAWPLVFQSCLCGPQLCNVNSPFLLTLSLIHKTEVRNSPCTHTWAYKQLLLNNQNTHTILN